MQFIFLSLLLTAMPDSDTQTCKDGAKALTAGTAQTEAIIFTPKIEFRKKYNWREELSKISGIEIVGVGRTGATLVATTDAIKKLRQTWGTKAFIEKAEVPQFGSRIYKMRGKS